MPAPENLALVVTVDGLSAQHLASYGNLAFPAPRIDQLAASGHLFEFCQPEHLAPERCFGDLTRGLEDLNSQGIETVLLTDDPLILPTASSSFQQIISLVDAMDEPDRLAVDFYQTQMAQLFGQASEWLDPPPTSRLVWIHSRGWRTAWDAPYSLRQLFQGTAEEAEDPDPPTWLFPPVAPESFHSGENAEPAHSLLNAWDPDERLGIYQAFAGQLQVFDRCVGALIGQLPEATRTLLALTSLRGFPLAEHGRVGGDSGCLYGETHHVPLVVSLPMHPVPVRYQPLVQNSLLPQWVYRWLTASEQNWELPELEASQLTLTSSDAGAILRSPAWCLIAPTDRSCELYVKPDDRFETNNVASRCPDVVQSMEELLQDALANPDRIADLPLPQKLIDRWR